jgi:DNA transposition AAA+ family ATPase
LLSEDEIQYLLEQRRSHLGMQVRREDFTDQEAVTAIIRITGGNFRLIHRQLMPVERILQINELQTVMKEVVEAARENLGIGLA